MRSSEEIAGSGSAKLAPARAAKRAVAEADGPDTKYRGRLPESRPVSLHLVGVGLGILVGDGLVKPQRRRLSRDSYFYEVK